MNFKKNYPKTMNILFCIAILFFSACAMDSSNLSNETTSLQGVSLNHSEYILKIDDSVTLVATVGMASSIYESVTWNSSNSSVAKVDSSGRVTAVNEGSAIIIASAVNDNKAICFITVYSDNK